MKKFFRGFTIAELLLCIAIIGVVSALGANIAKKTTEKAYRAYYTAGYENLYNALADIRARGEDEDDEGFSISKADLASRLRDEFGVPKQADDDDTVARTKNGIIYNIILINKNQNAIPNTWHPGSYFITMRVPQPKTRQNREGLSEEFTFFYNKNGIGYLLPLNNDLLHSTAYLKFYINHGKQVMRSSDGRLFERQSGDFIPPLSYHDAACNAYGGLIMYLPNAIASEAGLSGESTASPPLGDLADTLYFWGRPPIKRGSLEYNNLPYLSEWSYQNTTEAQGGGSLPPSAFYYFCPRNDNPQGGTVQLYK